MKLATELRTRETSRRGRWASASVAVMTSVLHACASGAGSESSARNFFVAKPTTPRPISAPTMHASIVCPTFTDGIERPCSPISSWASCHGISRRLPDTPSACSACDALSRCRTCSSGSEKMAPLTIAMPDEPATCARLRKRTPAGLCTTFCRQPQQQRTTSGLTPGVMPALSPAMTIVAESRAVTSVPTAMAPASTREMSAMVRRRA
mmetsp:Transcript_47246/g.122104  ORF Transcript_47246/g.122104 Transcript_47246/m.122104 type:complete len:208 (-) Transcript_47246:65-688(-)